MVTVLVGAGQRPFLIHTGLLTHYSSYFRAALKNNWEEDKTNTVPLTEDDPDVFQAVFDWLYSGRLYPALTSEGKIPYDSQRICEIFVLGDFLGVPEMCNAALDLFVQWYIQTWTFLTEPLNYIYNNTVSGSPLRRLVVCLASRGFSWNSAGVPAHEQDESRYPKKFLLDVIGYSIQINHVPGQLTVPKEEYIEQLRIMLCEFHDHSSPASHAGS